MGLSSSLQLRHKVVIIVRQLKLGVSIPDFLWVSSEQRLAIRSPTLLCTLIKYLHFGEVVGDVGLIFELFHFESSV